MPRRATSRVLTNTSATPNPEERAGALRLTSDVEASRLARDNREQGEATGRRARGRRRRRRSWKERKIKRQRGTCPSGDEEAVRALQRGRKSRLSCHVHFLPYSSEECFLNGELSKARVRHLIPGSHAGSPLVALQAAAAPKEGRERAKKRWRGLHRRSGRKGGNCHRALRSGAHSRGYPASPLLCSAEEESESEREPAGGENRRAAQTRNK